MSGILDTRIPTYCNSVWRYLQNDNVFLLLSIFNAISIFEPFCTSKAFKFEWLPIDYGIFGKIDIQMDQHQFLIVTYFIWRPLCYILGVYITWFRVFWYPHSWVCKNKHKTVHRCVSLTKVNKGKQRWTKSRFVVGKVWEHLNQVKMFELSYIVIHSHKELYIQGV